MKKLKIVILLPLLMACAFQLGAKSAPDSDSVWKRHAGYYNIGYDMQTLEFDNQQLKSDLGLGYSLGRTFFLHKKPIAGLMKFGLDWTFMDFSFAKFSDVSIVQRVEAEGMDMAGDYEDFDEIGLPELGVMKMDVGMGFGPSFTINPVDYLKAGIYFHVTPSYSIFMQDTNFMGAYSTFFNLGFHIAYKVISFGIEHRWCKPASYTDLLTSDFVNNYFEMFLPEGEDMEDVNIGEILGGESGTAVMPATATSSTRVYISFRFGGKR